MGMGRVEVRFLEMIWFCMASWEKNLGAMVGHFDEVYRRGLKINADKSKVMVLNGEKGMECEVSMDGMRLEHMSEFKYLDYVLNESGTDSGEREINCRCDQVPG